MKTQLILIHCIIGLLTQIIHGIDNQENLEYPLNQRIEDDDFERLCNDKNVTLSFIGLNLHSLENYFLSSPIITCVNLSRNSIQNIRNHAFDNLQNLKYLNLEGNSFDLRNIFSNNLTNVETLILNDNSQDSGEVELSIVYPKLKKLFVNNAYNYFTANSDNIFPSLTHLYLRDTGVQVDKFSWLPKTLEYLDLSGHNLHTLTLKGLTNLEWLLLDNPYEKNLNNIKFENLNKLKFLSVPSNTISEITKKTFVNTSSLLYLDLSDNYIRYIDGGSLNSMKNLKYLNLSNNQIDVISGGTFDKLKNLETLALEKNKISTFPMIENEMKLKRLYLNCNQLKGIIGGTFMKMPNLEHLFLHGNELSYIDQESFMGLYNLKTLTLSYNELSNLPANWMQSMTSLQELDLTGNNFLNLGDLSLSENSPLQFLYLSNQLKFMHASSVYTIPENSTISFDPNFIFVEKCMTDEERQSRYYG